MSIKEEFVIKINKIVIKALIANGVEDKFEEESLVSENPPSREMGDVAYPLFKYAKVLKKAPQVIAQDVKKYIDDKYGTEGDIEKIETKGPYLNVFFNRNKASSMIINEILDKELDFAKFTRKNEKVLIEFSSPNTNKPLHLGHCRNNVLGDSIARIFDRTGYDVVKLNLINDRGIHICKSMLAYKKFGNSVDPKELGKKSDHFVGDMYVKFAAEEKNNPDLEKEAQEMLVLWEQKDPEVRALWEKMNKWAIDGIKETYAKMGIEFDQYQFESQNYLLGKDIIEKGLAQNAFYKEADNSVWVNNEDVGLDKKILIRSDGTSIYITQDIGTATERHKQFNFDKMFYVVASEQIYHFKTLFAILKKAGYDWADNCKHLSYGMVNLRGGKMKSREGTVVDADNLMELLASMAYEVIDEKQADWDKAEKEEIAQKIGLSALKYYLLNFSTTKDILFIPEQSISFDGNTGPYLQYTTARINSLLLKAKDITIDSKHFTGYQYNSDEWNLVAYLMEFETALKKAEETLSPLEICSYLYQLTKFYNKFYHDNPIINADDDIKQNVRVAITRSTAIILKIGLNLLGIDALEKM